jgi:hypothetical protein
MKGTLAEHRGGTRKRTAGGTFGNDDRPSEYFDYDRALFGLHRILDDLYRWDGEYR